MSARLYVTGIWYYLNRGGSAKLHGEQVTLDNPPSLLGIEEIEYVPEVQVRRMRRKHDGWTDMEATEVRAADEWLRLKLCKA